MNTLAGCANTNYGLNLHFREHRQNRTVLQDFADLVLSIICSCGLRRNRTSLLGFYRPGYHLDTNPFRGRCGTPTHNSFTYYCFSRAALHAARYLPYLVETLGIEPNLYALQAYAISPDLPNLHFVLLEGLEPSKVTYSKYVCCAKFAINPQ